MKGENTRSKSWEKVQSNRKFSVVGEFPWLLVVDGERDERNWRAIYLCARHWHLSMRHGPLSWDLKTLISTDINGQNKHFQEYVSRLWLKPKLNTPIHEQPLAKHASMAYGDVRGYSFALVSSVNERITFSVILKIPNFVPRVWEILNLIFHAYKL